MRLMGSTITGAEREQVRGRDLGVEPHVAAAAANVLRAIRVDTT